MENFNFAWFTKTRNRLSDPRISINRNISIGFNAALVRKYGLREYPFVVLGYDKSRNSVGCKFLKKKEQGVLTVRFSNSDSGITNSKNFFIDNKLQSEKINGRHVINEVKIDNEEIILAVNLPK